MHAETTKDSTRFDITWTLSLFGTAVGAGILFLPISAGMGGFWPLVIMTIFVGPMIYYAHRGLARFVLASCNKASDITEVVEEYFGPGVGKLITWLYFFAIFPILLIYGVGLTNTVESFLVNQLGWAVLPRAFLSLVIVSIMMGGMLTGEKVMLRVTAWIVYPLCTILLFLSLFLIPHWRADMIGAFPSVKDLVFTLWMTLPVLVFAFNHSPAISSFAMAHCQRYGANAEVRASKTLRRTATLLVFFVMFFVFSCVLCLSPEDLMNAKRQNISMLSYLANEFDSPFISYFGPFIAFLAISSSFFGHYLGAREGLRGIVVKFAQERGKIVQKKSMERGIALFFFVTLWLVASLNPGILNMIESLGGPIIAILLFIMPVYATHKVPAMQKYAGAASNTFMLVTGIVAISAILPTLMP